MESYCWFCRACCVCLDSEQECCFFPELSAWFYNSPWAVTMLYVVVPIVALGALVVLLSPSEKGKESVLEKILQKRGS